MAIAFLAPDTYMPEAHYCRWFSAKLQACDVSSEGTQTPQWAFAFEHQVTGFYPTLCRSVKSDLTC